MDCHCLINKTTPLVPAKGDKGDTVLVEEEPFADL